MVGFPCVGMISGTLWNAAQHHADYIATNFHDTNCVKISGHYEWTGCPIRWAFSPDDRCKKSGYLPGCQGELVASKASNPGGSQFYTDSALVLSRLLATPYHGAALLDSRLQNAAFGGAQVINADAGTFDFHASSGARQQATWPWNGATGVYNVGFTHQEQPAPPTCPLGGLCGPPVIFVLNNFSVTSTSFKMTHQGQTANIGHTLIHAGNDPNALLTNEEFVLLPDVLPVSRFHEAKVCGTQNGVPNTCHTVTFTTGGGPP
jgi:hypothetical protein